MDRQTDDLLWQYRTTVQHTVKTKASGNLISNKQLKWWDVRLCIINSCSLCLLHKINLLLAGEYDD